MPDWRPYLRARLGPLGLRREREEEILAELADHLEDQSKAMEEKADGRAKRVEDGTDWPLLARTIRHAEEETMSPTARTLWVPGVGMLLFSFILLLAMTNLVPPTTWVDPKAPVLLMAPWLLSYLAFGALGAWWSRRAGGSRAARFFSGMFPLALQLVLYFFPIIVMAPFAPAWWPPVSVTLGWVVVPGVALAIGTVPFLRDAASA